MNLYQIIEAANHRGVLSAILHAICTTYWTFEFVPLTLSFIYSISVNSTPKSNYPTPLKLAILAYTDISNTRKICRQIHHTTICDSPFYIDEYQHKTNCIVTKDAHNHMWISFSGLDITELTSIGAIGSVYYDGLDELELHGKVITSFKPPMSLLERFKTYLRNNSTSEIHVVGHSMGTALALITAAHLAKQFPMINVNTHLYAPIAFCDKEFLDMFHPSSPTYIRNLRPNAYLHEDDIICHLFSSLKITNQNVYKQFSISSNYLPFQTADGTIKTTLLFESMSVLDLFNPIYYSKHQLHSFEHFNGG